MVVVDETNLGNGARKRLSLARYLSNESPEIIILQAVAEGKIVFKKRKNLTSIDELSSIQSVFSGSKLNSEPKPHLDEYQTSSREAEAQALSETKSCSVKKSDDVARNDEGGMKDGNGYKEKSRLKSISIIRRELPAEVTFGWPLLQRTTPLSEEVLRRRTKARSMSLIERVTNLPTLCSEAILMQNQTDSDSDSDYEANICLDSKTQDAIVNNEGISFQVAYSSENESVDGSSNREDVVEPGPVQDNLMDSFSVLEEESTQLRLGWPLLRIKTSATLDSKASEMMSLPNQSTQATPKSHIVLPFREVEGSADKLELVIKLKKSGCNQLSYEELERATHNFSSENLIGEGGCSNVYKGRLRRGKIVAVKVLKRYKEAWNDFSLEADIMASLKHKHITHLIGICVEGDHLILVYDFLPKGNLEEMLQGHDKKLILPWKMRFKIAIAISQALNYLHNECSRSVIHRDVKSANILLSNDFQPQLSDFGLATWGPEDAVCIISSDIVGTFGYIAPEYFMHGRVSEKVDIYSFGIVLLELLTGKRPISSKDLQEQENLVMWAMPFLERTNLEALVDPKLDGKFNIAQMHRMVLAATLCIKHSPRLRPKASQILELFSGEIEVKEWMNTYINDLKQSSYEFDDLFPELENNPKPDFSLVLDDDESSLNSDDTASLRSVGQSQHFRLKDYLKEELG